MSSENRKTLFGCGFVSASERGRLVSGQFDRVAGTYDLANTVLSFGLHLFWRRWGIEQLHLRNGERVLDVCGGTGDLAMRAAARVAPLGRAFSYDFNRAMTRAGRRKAERSRFAECMCFVGGDAARLSFRDDAFDAITVGFGIRNLADLGSALSEMHRVLKPGGRLMILEFSHSVRGWLRPLYDFYSFRLMPLGARIVCGTAEPYRYLAESIRAFDIPERVVERLENAGFSEVRFRRLTGGIAVVYLAQRP